MKKLFFRNFIKIISVTLLTILIIGIAIIIEFNTEQYNWKKKTYETYNEFIENSMKTLFSEKGYVDGNTIKGLVSTIPDDHISGIIFRTADSQMFVLGFEPNGKSLDIQENSSKENSRFTLFPQLFKNRKFYQTDLYFKEMGKELYVDSDENSISVNMNKEMLAYPEIIGSTSIYLNDKKFGTAYLLVHSFLTYEASADLFDKLFNYLKIVIPMAILLSLLLSLRLSYSNAKYINSTKNALESLTKGKRNIIIPKGRILLMNEISKSINELDLQLQENEHNRNEWLRSISHDLNTPVTSIKLILEGIKDKVFPLNESTLASLEEETNQLETRIHSITDYSSLLTQKTVKINEIDSSEFTGNLISNFDEKLISKLVIENDIKKFRGDEKLIFRSCVEILKNAQNASCNNNEPIYWKLKENEEFTYFEFINKANLNKSINLMEPWTKEDWSRQTTGSGMGLSIVNQILNL
ncbi:MAG: HAMP domain-containing sensor histidine kinase, partial [Sphaerochaetaceae bacterium]